MNYSCSYSNDTFQDDSLLCYCVGIVFFTSVKYDVYFVLQAFCEHQWWLRGHAVHTITFL